MKIDPESMVDIHGTDVIGDDEDGRWIGTEVAALTMGEETDGPPLDIDDPHYIRLNAYLGAEELDATYIANKAEFAVNFLIGIGCKDVRVAECRKLKCLENITIPAYSVVHFDLKDIEDVYE